MIAFTFCEAIMAKMAIFNLLFTVILIFSSVTDRKAKIID